MVLPDFLVGARQGSIFNCSGEGGKSGEGAGVGVWKGVCERCEEV